MVVLKKIMNLVFAILMLCVLTGCPNKESSKSDPTNQYLVGVYHTEFKQDGDSYEPETLYTFKADGTLQVEYYYEKRGKGPAYKEVSFGKYRVEGDQLKVFDFKPSNCSEENRLPQSFVARFKKEAAGVRIFTSEGESQFFELADKKGIQKFNGVKICNQEKIENQSDGQPVLPGQSWDGFSPSPAENANPTTTPKIERSVPDAGLPPEIKTVVINPKNDSNSPRGEPYIQFENETWVDKIVNASKVDCLSANECPSFVGLLIGRSSVAGKIVMYQCSVTYLGDGYFSTNSHCYPRETKGNSFVTNCQGELWVKMPATSSNKEQVFSCEKVVYLTKIASEESYKGSEPADVMIFKVKEPVEREAAKIDWNATIDQKGEPLTAWVVDPDHSEAGINGTIVKKTCTTFDPRNVLPWLSSEPLLKDYVYQNVSVTSCSKKMMKGNSGSTLFNAAGKGIAIFSHLYVENKTLTQSDSGFGTKYACTSPAEIVGPQTRSSRPCITISNEDIGMFVTNGEIKSHNTVVKQIETIESKIRNLVQNPIKSDQKDENLFKAESLVSIDPSAKFKFSNWKWLKIRGDYRRSEPIVYKPPGKYYVENIQRPQDGHGNFLLNYNPSPDEVQNNLTDFSSGRSYINDFSDFRFVLPECIDYDPEKLKRVRKDRWLELFSPREYVYDLVDVDVPILGYFQTEYKVVPKLITQQSDIEGIQLLGATQLVRLPFKIYIRFRPGEGGISELIGCATDKGRDRNPVAKAIETYFNNMNNGYSDYRLKKCR